MTLKIKIFNQNDSTQIEKEIEENTVLADLDIPGTFTTYYEIGSILENKSLSLPFIINSQNQVKWNVPYNEVFIVDFIKTHAIKDNTLQVKWGKCDPLISREISEKLLYINISTLLNFTIVIHTIFKDLAKKSNTHPLYILDFILRKDIWNIDKLSEYLQYDENRLIRLLEAIGYNALNSDCLYSIDKNTIKELKHKIKSTDLSSPIN